MIYSHVINGLPVNTGDLICTANGGASPRAGHFWWPVGKIIPGDVDHIVIYVGPKGQCVEAGAKGRVIEFDLGSNQWDASGMMEQRSLLDALNGIAYPLKGRGLPEDQKNAIRKSVGKYCLAQARPRKRYQFNFLNSSIENIFYCSQLAYQAHSKHGIDLNSGIGVPDIPDTDSIIYPHKVREGWQNSRSA